MANQIVGTLNIQSGGSPITAVTVDEVLFNDNFTIGLDGTITAIANIDYDTPPFNVPQTFTANVTNLIGTTTETFTITVTDDVTDNPPQSVITSVSLTDAPNPVSSTSITFNLSIALTSPANITIETVPVGGGVTFSNNITVPIGVTSFVEAINADTPTVGNSMTILVSVTNAPSSIDYTNPIGTYTKTNS